MLSPYTSFPPRYCLLQFISPPQRSSYTYRPASVNTLLSLREKFHLLNTENRCCKVTSVKLSPFLSIEIGRASCRERGMISAEGGPVVKKKEVEEVRD